MVVFLNLREGGDILRMGKEVKANIKRLQGVYPTITLLSSWILSLTMIPFLCVFFLKVKADPEKKGFDSKYYRFYRRSLGGLLKHPLITLLAVSIIFIITMQGFRFIPKIFFPPSDKAIYTAEIELPIGTPIEYTEKVVKSIEKFMNNELVAKDDHKEGITNWATFIGQGAREYKSNHGIKSKEIIE